MKEANYYLDLLNAVEHKLGKRLITPRDFKLLSNEVDKLLKKEISVSTIKRLWGYICTDDNYSPHTYTLDTLAEYAGYKDFETFILRKQETASSSPINDTHLFCSELLSGDIISLTWLPDRTVEIKFLGQDMFVITKSVNSKLNVGDTFCCGCFIENQPLVLLRLIHDNMPPQNYMCGKEGGIKYELYRNYNPRLSPMGGGNANT